MYDQGCALVLFSETSESVVKLGCQMIYAPCVIMTVEKCSVVSSFVLCISMATLYMNMGSAA